MRVAIIAPPWYPVPPSGYGGIEWVVSLLADGLTDRGHQVTLFAPPGSETEARLEPPLGKVPPEELIGDPWYEAAHAMSAYDRGGEFDVLHDHTGPVGVSIGAMSECPTVHTLHGPFTDETKMLYRRIARRHWFVAISESQRSMAPENLRWAGVVYNGIPIDRYALRADKEEFLLFLGRADEEKAPHLAIEAARRAGRRLVMCVTIKNERERSYWAEQVEPLLDDDVEVRGECDQDQKADLLARARALLFPIQWPEPFGLVMTEAMACGTPVVAWRNGSVPEVVVDGETGFIVSSVEEMATAVDRVHELDPQTMRARVEQRFSADAMVTGYEDVYRQVLAHEHRPGRSPRP
ncbi:MAG TPA: glycosyltransferase family 4 protein [Actinomycetes bacterium]|nr:glycosyltransferase family 4 protein [Actinomycetes bacterium]